MGGLLLLHSTSTPHQHRTTKTAFVRIRAHSAAGGPGAAGVSEAFDQCRHRCVNVSAIKIPDRRYRKGLRLDGAKWWHTGSFCFADALRLADDEFCVAS
jgi:hypothetical protein